MPTLAGKKHLSVHFFLHGPCLFHRSMEKVRVQSVKKGHQKGCSRADTINNCTFVSPIYTFPWRETELFTRQIKLQIGKSNLIILSIEG